MSSSIYKKYRHVLSSKHIWQSNMLSNVNWNEKNLNARIATIARQVTCSIRAVLYYHVIALAMSHVLHIKFSGTYHPY